MKFPPFSQLASSKPYIIAEIGANHNGDIDLACRMIDIAAEKGADCAKFQSWTKDSIFSKSVYKKNCFLKDDYRNRSDYTLESIVEAYSMSEAQLKTVADHCRSIGIDFASTPFSQAELDFLVDDLDAPFIKIASMDCNNYPFLARVAKKGRPVVLSTGLCHLEEVDRAVRTLEEHGCAQICLLHCVANYPPLDHTVNLRNMHTLRVAYPDCPIGYSDHSLGTAIPLAAVALGACVIEKHFTLDKTMPGWDHKVSADPQELADIVEGSRRIHAALGTTRRGLTAEDEVRKPAFRRSVVVTRDLKKGHVIRQEDLDCKRPGEGLEPEWIDFIIGRTLQHDVAADQMVRREDF